jgi:hypothetical protein
MRPGIPFSYALEGTLTVQIFAGWMRWSDRSLLEKFSRVTSIRPRGRWASTKLRDGPGMRGPRDSAKLKILQ